MVYGISRSCSYSNFGYGIMKEMIFYEIAHSYFFSEFCTIWVAFSTSEIVLDNRQQYSPKKFVSYCEDFKLCLDQGFVKGKGKENRKV